MNEKKTESEFLMKKRQLGELFDSKIPVKTELYRGQKPENRGEAILYPILKEFLLSNGTKRPVDIETYQRNGEWWVDSDAGGVSLFDVLGVPVGSWDYYRIAAGSLLPPGLVITKDRLRRSPNKRVPSAFHYTIRPNWDMPLKQFLFALDDLTNQFNRVK